MERSDMLLGLNHITLATSDLERSFAFYTATLGLEPRAKWNKGAYLSLGDLWLCLSCDETGSNGDYSHIAFDIDEDSFLAFERRLLAAGVEKWKENISEGASLYILDPDGHKLEIHAGTLESRLLALRSTPPSGLILY